jgi:hypothetical protein
MIFHPGVIALLLGSTLTTAMLCYSAYEGLRILRKWDITSGSELQLELERRTYLISTIMSYVLSFELLSLFLFVYTADTISSLFVGAMCAAGSLKVNVFGYPAIILKMVNFLIAGIWIIINYTDNKAHDYPLIKVKYGLLLAITPLLVVDTIMQSSYLLGLKPNIITSCCGTLFTADSQNIMSDIIALPRILSQLAFDSSVTITLATGLYFYLYGKGAYLFSISSLVMFFVSIVAIISLISIYFYELPTHHCPFCILHQEYGYVGYWIYATILVGAVSGLGVGSLMPFRKIHSIKEIVPRIQKKLALISILSYAAFVSIVGYGILFSNLTMSAY